MRRFQSRASAAAVALRNPFAMQPMPWPVLKPTAFVPDQRIAQLAVGLRRDASDTCSHATGCGWNEGAAAFIACASAALNTLPTAAQIDSLRSMLVQEIDRARTAIKEGPVTTDSPEDGDKFNADFAG